MMYESLKMIAEKEGRLFSNAVSVHDLSKPNITMVRLHKLSHFKAVQASNVALSQGAQGATNTLDVIFYAKVLKGELAKHAVGSVFAFAAPSCSIHMAFMVSIRNCSFFGIKTYLLLYFSSVWIQGK